MKQLFSKTTRSKHLVIGGYSTRNFGLLQSIKESFSKPPQIERYKQSGKAVIEYDSEISNNEHAIQFEENFVTKYNSNNEIVISNYGSSIMPYDNKHLPLTLFHKNINNELSWRANVLGKTYAGIIVHIPSNLKQNWKHTNKTLNKGDRIWGITLDQCGYAFADHKPLNFNNVCHAPINIPLQYAPPFLMGFYLINACLNYQTSKLKNKNDLQSKSVIIIGCSFYSYLTSILYYFDSLEVSDITIKFTSEREQNALQDYIESVRHTMKTTTIDTIDWTSNNNDNIKQYDLVVNTSKYDTEFIMENALPFCKTGGHLWLLHNPFINLFGIGYSGLKGFATATLEYGKWIKTIDKKSKKQLHVRTIPAILTGKMHLNELKEFTDYLNAIEEPHICIEKEIDLNDVKEELNWFSNDSANRSVSMLSDCISVVVKEEEMEHKCNITSLNNKFQEISKTG